MRPLSIALLAAATVTALGCASESLPADADGLVSASARNFTAWAEAIEARDYTAMENCKARYKEIAARVKALPPDEVTAATNRHQKELQEAVMKMMAAQAETGNAVMTPDEWATLSGDTPDDREDDR